MQRPHWVGPDKPDFLIGELQDISILVAYVTIFANIGYIGT